MMRLTCQITFSQLRFVAVKRVKSRGARGDVGEGGGESCGEAEGLHCSVTPIELLFRINACMKEFLTRVVSE